MPARRTRRTPSRPPPRDVEDAPVRVVRTRRGARLVQRGLVLSEIASRPMATDSLFDVLAAAVAALAPGPRVAMLGFAGGGVVAPLRAMGFGHPLAAVDLSLEGERWFRRLSGPWAGKVTVQRDDAVRWLRRQRRPFDLVLEDLSVAASGDVTKPEVSLSVLPALLRRKLGPAGVAVINVLPVPGWSWPRLLGRLGAPWSLVQVVTVPDYENRILLAGRLPGAARTSRLLGRFLRALGSDQASGLRVRTLVRSLRTVRHG